MPDYLLLGANSDSMRLLDRWTQMLRFHWPLALVLVYWGHESAWAADKTWDFTTDPSGS